MGKVLGGVALSSAFGSVTDARRPQIVCGSTTSCRVQHLVERAQWDRIQHFLEVMQKPYLQSTRIIFSQDSHLGSIPGPEITRGPSHSSS